MEVDYRSCFRRTILKTLGYHETRPISYQCDSLLYHCSLKEAWIIVFWCEYTSSSFADLCSVDGNNSHFHFRPSLVFHSNREKNQVIDHFKRSHSRSICSQPTCTQLTTPRFPQSFSKTPFILRTIPWPGDFYTTSVMGSNSFSSHLFSHLLFPTRSVSSHLCAKFMTS